MSKHKETMSNVDTAWLQMDRPTNLMMIASFMIFDEPIDYERFLQTIERRLLAFDRFRQRVVPPRTPFGNYSWELDPHFDLRAHIHRAAVPAPGDKAALQNMMSDIISTPLDRSRPLWQYHLLEGYQGGTVVASRMHHSIADGIALMRVLLSLTDLTPDSRRSPTRPKSRSRPSTVACWTAWSARPRQWRAPPCAPPAMLPASPSTRAWKRCATPGGWSMWPELARAARPGWPR